MKSTQIIVIMIIIIFIIYTWNKSLKAKKMKLHDIKMSLMNKTQYCLTVKTLNI